MTLYCTIRSLDKNHKTQVFVCRRNVGASVAKESLPRRNVNCCISSKLLDSQLFKLKSTNHVLFLFKLLWNQQTEAVHTGTPALVCCDVMFQCYSSTRTKRRHGHDRRLKGTICCVIWATMRRRLPASRSRLPPKSECVSVGAVQLLPVSDCRPSGTVPRPVS